MPTALLVPDPPVTDVTDYQARGGGEAYRRAVTLGPGATIQEVVLSGLRGRGGAGFPTGRKWRSVRDAAADEGTTFAVCNAAEGEPGTFKDRAILRANPYAVVEGLAVAAFAVGAERAFVGIKESFAPEVGRLASAVEEMSGAGLIGDVAVQVVLGPDHYLFGEETALLQVIEGGDPLPRNVPPYVHGLFATTPAAGWTPTGGVVATEFASANPTLVNNVETLAAASLVLARGPEWHRSLGTGRSPGVVVCTVVGDVVKPGVGEVEMGTPLQQVIDDVGGGVRAGRTVKAVLSGVANPVIVAANLDVPVSYEGMEAIGTGLGAAGFIVYDDTTPVLELARMVSGFLAVESCGQCPPCKLNTANATEILERLALGDGGEDDVEQLSFALRRVADGNRCYLPVQEQQVVASILDAFPEEVAAALSGEAVPARGLTLPKLTDLHEGTATYDEKQQRKRPDWTYEPD
jgi:NADH:ubiquinone oxidoreductase subunit F (NADH-binding)